MSQSTDILDEITTAYRDALAGKTVRFNGREITTHDLPALRKEMSYWEGKVASENGSGHKPFRVVL